MSARDAAGVRPVATRFVLVGALPPPVHGMAAVNASIRDQLSTLGKMPLVVDMAADTLRRSVWGRLRRLPRVCGGWLRVLCAQGLHGGTLYMSLSGGWGQLYEIPFVLLAKVRRMRIVLHHHSFAYLDRRRLLTRILVSLAGTQATHVVLSARMAAELARRYPAATQITTVSNAALLRSEPAMCEPRIRHQLRTLGFLGNISADKGIFEFIDLLAAAAASGLPVRGKVAGPFQDADTQRQVRARLAGIDCIDYVGPKYGPEKEAYFDGLDALVFPTRYPNEAEPLTIHEAMSRGLPVIAVGRGAIGEIVASDCGCVVPPDDAFIEAALEQISAWCNEPSVFESASGAALQRFDTLAVNSLRHWRDLLARLLSSTS